MAHLSEKGGASTPGID
jgi:hypothetical protein